MSIKNITSNKGSIWRKWDLHIHTPFTKLNNQFVQLGDEEIWRTYCEKIEESDVEAFGITDYFSCENYFTFLEKFKHYYPNSSKVFFPNIEFRLEIAVNKQGEEVNIHVIFSNETHPQSVMDFLAHLETNHTTSSGVKVNCRDLAPNQFESATVNHNNIISSLEKIFGNDKTYIIVCAVNNAGLRPTNSPRKLAITDEIDKLCDAFFGGRQNVDHYVDTDRYETNEASKPKPIICGCDAHSFSDMDNWLGKHVTRNIQPNNEEIIKDITWIKADLSFEGLKQILFEPQHRISISEIEPRKPVRRIESIQFKFPADTLIKRTNSQEQMDFCLKKLNTPIYFNDYFTCIIGGRGTGKSTIINLLAEKLNEKTDFFKRSKLLMSGQEYDVENDESDFIEVSGTNEIEFVSQGRIEKLAEGNELTRLIFNERIKEIEGGFLEIDSKLLNIIEKIDKNIDILFKFINNASDQKEKEKEKLTYQKIIDSINDPRYIVITTRLKVINDGLSKIQKSQKNYSNLAADLASVILKYPSQEEPNQIDDRIKEIIDTLQNIDEIDDDVELIGFNLKQFQNINAEVVELNQQLAAEHAKLEAFFKEKGTNEETIKDSKKAVDIVSRLDKEITVIKAVNGILRKEYDLNRSFIQELPSLYIQKEGLIKSNLDKINDKLKVKDENVLEISFVHEFNFSLYQDKLFEDFYNYFKAHHIANTSESRIKEVLFLIKPDRELLGLDHSAFMNKLNSVLSEFNYNKDNNYVKVVVDILSHAGNYLVYTHLIEKHLFNLGEFIKIKGFYGNTDLQSSSFGQRCTAVIVTLLMTGVKPLVIDEPEAHLDNKLIADYLVGLVKTKQLDRQIIFASHNSNFVINGDAGLIHILEIPNTGVHTNKTSTTIENTSNREQLLKLEGGREAFLARESKYGI